MMFKYKIRFDLGPGQPLNKNALIALANSPYQLVVDTSDEIHEPTNLVIEIESIEYDRIISDEDLSYLKKQLFPGYEEIYCSATYIGKNLNLEITAK